MQIPEVLGCILTIMSEIGKWQRDFLTELFEVIFLIGPKRYPPRFPPSRGGPPVTGFKSKLYFSRAPKIRLVDGLNETEITASWAFRLVKLNIRPDPLSSNVRRPGLMLRASSRLSKGLASSLATSWGFWMWPIRELTETLVFSGSVF